MVSTCSQDTVHGMYAANRTVEGTVFAVSLDELSCLIWPSLHERGAAGAPFGPWQRLACRDTTRWIFPKRRKGCGDCFRRKGVLVEEERIGASKGWIGVCARPNGELGWGVVTTTAYKAGHANVSTIYPCVYVRRPKNNEMKRLDVEITVNR